jgi:hypothetical protein
LLIIDNYETHISDELTAVVGKFLDSVKMRDEKQRRKNLTKINIVNGSGESMTVEQG